MIRSSSHGGAVSLLLLACLAACSPRSGPTGPSADDPVSSYSLLARLHGAEVSSPSILVRAVEIGGEERAAIWAPAPATVRFADVPVGRSATLRFGIGLRPGGTQSDGVEFAVRIVGADGESEIWRQPLTPTGPPRERRWTDVALPLDAYQGQRVGIVFETSPRDDPRADFSVWGLPVVVAAAPIAEQAPPIQRRLLASRLDTEGENVVELPAAASRHLAGEVVRVGVDDVPRKGVVFRVLLDGQVLVERELRSTARVTSFGDDVPLTARADGPVKLRFEVVLPAGSADKLRAHWLHAALLHAESTPRRAAGPQPNVLLVVVDTLRADHLSAYGYERETSPVFDRLARQSVLFEQAISSSSWTLPATASMLTGLYPTQHGTADGRPLALELETLAERAQAAGMTTFGISANPIVGEAEGFDQGHERFVHVPWARATTVNDLLEVQLSESAPYRWYGYVHFIDPHDPYDAPEPFASTFASGYESPLADRKAFAAFVDSTNFGGGEVDHEERDLDYLRAAYDGEILYWDAQLGRLLDTLDRLGLRDDTVVIVASDHGEEFLEHGRMKHGPHLYEESIQVPLLVHAPGRLAAGRVGEAVETRLIAALTDGLIAGRVPGSAAELTRILRPRRGVIFSHSTHGLIGPGQGRTPLMAVRDERWKLHRYPDQGWQELYDLQRDPGERRDLVGEEEATARRYVDLLDAWHRATADRSLQEGSLENQRILEKLRSLGYIQ